MATLKNPTLGSVKKPTKVNMLGNAAATMNKPIKVNMRGNTAASALTTKRNQVRQEVAAMSTNMRGKAYTQNRTKTSLAGYQAPAARSAQTALNKKATKKTLLNKKSGLYKEPVIR